jgi:hypothetical protein
MIIDGVSIPGSHAKVKWRRDPYVAIGPAGVHSGGSWRGSVTCPGPDGVWKDICREMTDSATILIAISFFINCFMVESTTVPWLIEQIHIMIDKGDLMCSSIKNF